MPFIKIKGAANRYKLLPYVATIMKLNMFLILPLVLLLAGCSTEKHLTYSYITTNSAPSASIDKNAQTQLADAANSVNHSLQQMSSIDKATHPKAKIKAPMNPKQIGMEQQTSLNWNGPIEPLLRRIAQASNYKLRVLGQRHAIPVMVSIDENNVPLATILRNATYQVEKKANVVVYPSTKTIELRYYSS